MADRWEIGDGAKCVNVRDIRIPLRTLVAQGGRYLELGRVYPVRGMDMSYYGQLCLDVGAEGGPKLAQRFVKVPREEIEESADAGEKVPA